MQACVGGQRDLKNALAEVLPALGYDGSVDAFARLSSAEDVSRLRAAVLRLPQRDQTILSLYYQEELTYREIGDVLGVTESRICQILRALQKKLRVELEAR